MEKLIELIEWVSGFSMIYALLVIAPKGITRNMLAVVSSFFALRGVIKVLDLGSSLNSSEIVPFFISMIVLSIMIAVGLEKD